MHANSTAIKNINQRTLRQKISDDLIFELEGIAVNALKEEYQYETNAICDDNTLTITEKICKRREALLMFIGGIIFIKVLATVI